MNALNSFQQGAQAMIGKAINKAFWVGLGAAIAIALLTWFSVSSLASHAFRVTTEAEVRNLIVGGVQDVSELTSATTTIKATVVIKQAARALGIPIGETNLVYEGIGTVRAGISLDRLKVESLNVNQRQIQLLLPAPHIIDISLDVNRSSTLANYRRWFGPKAGAELYAAAQQKAIAEISNQACSNQVLEVASQNTQHIVAEILAKAGFEPTQIKIQTSQVVACAKKL